MRATIIFSEFPDLEEMIGLPEVVKDIENDIFETDISGSYIPNKKRVLEIELEHVKSRLEQFYN